MWRVWSSETCIVLIYFEWYQRDGTKAV
jgi:hypothetical protein